MDALLERLTAPAPAGAKLDPIPWPKGLAPDGSVPERDPSDPLPTADVLLWVYTEAEGQALADVFTPGIHVTHWLPYTEHWSEYEPQLTGRSPAHDEKAIASYALSQVGSTSVLVLKNNLHLATDGLSIPLRQAWRQIIGEVKPRLVIDSGTAGGIGTDAKVGDTVASIALKFDLTGRFKTAPFNGQSFAATAAMPADWGPAETLGASQHGQLPDDHMPAVRFGDVLTCDSFLFDDKRDTYHLRADDPHARCEEMDCAVLGLVAQDLGPSTMPAWCSLRSVSDPEENAATVKQEEQAANKTYEKYGYAAQAAALCACWQLIAQLDQG